MTGGRSKDEARDGSAADERPIRMLGVAGSLREESYNAALLRLAATLVPDGVELVTFDGLGAVEPYDEDVEREGTPPGVATWREAVRSADAAFFTTPEYNGSIPGQLKNALDWASRGEAGDPSAIRDSALAGRPVAVASVSTGQFGAVWAQQDLKKVLGIQGARTVAEPTVAVGGAKDAFDEDGALQHAPTVERLRELLAGLAAEVRKLRAAGAEPAGVVQRAAAR